MSSMIGPNGGPVLNQCCERCQALFDMIEKQLAKGPFQTSHMGSPTKIPFHNIQSLISSAADGCHLCNLVLSELDPKDVQYYLEDLISHPEHAWDQIVAVTPSGNETDPPVQSIAKLEESRLRENYAAHAHLCDFQIVESGNLKRHSIPSTTRSFETFNDIHHWISVCENDHQSCIDTRAARQCQPPTRLIYVGAFEPQPLIQLHESRQVPAGAKYVTLSHCWGPNMNFRLVSSRYKEFQEGLTMDQLPKTFGEAISLTRCLGIDYLWIDSMCIIQDSETDWEREALLMKDVYQGAFLNIAANAFFTPNGGLFQARNPLSVSPVSINLSLPSNEMKPVAFSIFPTTDGLGRVQNAPLSTRAWTIQERLLAPRTAHFLNNKVVWECPTLGASESDLVGLLDTSHGAIRGWAVSNPAENNSADCLRKWYEATRLYTRAELTFQTDKLMAVAGIAGFIKSMWDDPSIRYLAGLWSYQLEWSLLWSARGGIRGTSDPRVPSWSWASVRGYTSTYFFYSEQPPEVLVSILEAETYPVNDPLGPVNGGHIRLRGPVCRVDLILSSGSLALRLPSEDRPLDFYELDLDDEDNLKSSLLAGCSSLYLLAVIKNTYIPGNPIFGLVLRSTGINHGEYTRVGYWCVEQDDPSGEDVSEDGGANRSIVGEFHCPSLESKDFEELDHVSGRYTINII